MQTNIPEDSNLIKSPKGWRHSIYSKSTIVWVQFLTEFQVQWLVTTILNIVLLEIHTSITKFQDMIILKFRLAGICSENKKLEINWTHSFQWHLVKLCNANCISPDWGISKNTRNVKLIQMFEKVLKGAILIK